MSKKQIEAAAKEVKACCICKFPLWENVVAYVEKNFHAEDRAAIVERVAQTLNA